MSKLPQCVRKVLSWMAGSVISVVFGTSSSSAVTLGFEDVAVAPGVQLPVGDFLSNGFLFDTSLNDRTNLTNGTFIADNGTTYLAWEDVGGNNIITMSRVDGQPFNLISVDVAEWDQPEGSARQINIVGIYAGGPVNDVAQAFNLDGIFDVLGPIEDFETFTLGSAYANLSSVTFDGLSGLGANQIAIDNIVVTTVSEPSALHLLPLVVASIVCRRWAVLWPHRSRAKSEAGE